MTEKKLKMTKKASYRLRHDDRGKALLDDHDESEEMSMKQIRCLAIHQQDSPKLGERPSWRSYRPWREESYHRSARLEKQLKVLEDQIDKQVKRFQAQYSRALNPTRPKDVAKLLAPSSTPPLELATLSWLGDWRPSSILGLLSSLSRSSPTLASSLTHAGATEKAISQLIHDLRIEEAVIDEELTEIQANCILNLPFALAQEKPNGSTLDQVHAELKKVHRLIVKAQNFRSNKLHIYPNNPIKFTYLTFNRTKALETVVKKILCQSDAAEFLVAFSGIQETVHQFSKDYKLRKGPVCVPLTCGSENVRADSAT